MNDATKNTYALVTGASRGLGRAFAVALAKRRINLLLTSLPGEDLDAFCAQLEEYYGIHAACFECDLTDKSAIQQLVTWVKDHYCIHILVNNAGIGGTSEFEKTRFDHINDIIQLNIRAMVMLTHQLLPLLRAQPQSWILNVSSMACFTPMGYKTVYPASKVFVMHFSRGLQAELKGSGVFVGVVHPGPMRTNADCARRLTRQGFLGRLGTLTPAAVAEKAIARLFRKDPLILIGWMNKIQWLLMKTTPNRLRLPLVTRIMRREIGGARLQPIRHESIGYRSQRLAGSKCDG